MITIALVTQIQGNVSICKYTSGGKPFRLLYEIEIRTTQSEYSNFRVEYLDETYIFENSFTYFSDGFDHKKIKVENLVTHSF